MAGIPQHQGKPRAVIAPAGGGGSSFGPTFYGTGCTVSPSGFAGQGKTFVSGPMAQAPTTTWPIDYSACSSAVPASNTTNYPIIDAVQGGINASGGGDRFLGDMFAPNGTVTIGGGTETIFVEAKDISASGGGITGDGPSDATGSSLAGSVALLQ